MADEEVVSTTDAGDAQVADTTSAESAAAATPGTSDAAPQQRQSFINPADLPDEIKPHYQRMHSAYDKAMGKAKAVTARQSDLDLVDRYRSNPEFARQFLVSEAARLGLQLGQAPGQGAPANQGAAAPAALVDAIKARLPQELHWMAQSMADGQWAGHQALTAPLYQRQQEGEISERTAQYEDLAAKLSETAPGWEQHEDAMLELLDYLQSPAMTHRKYGDKLTLLHRIVTGDDLAVATAVRRQGEAARQRTTTGQSGRSVVTNIDERVRKAPNTRAAIEIAADEAVKELQRRGIAVPD